MGIEICAVGGYNEIGKNMTAIKVDDTVVVLDMGIHLESYIQYTQDEDIINLSAEPLIKVGAIPNDSVIDEWKDNVKVIIPTHAHLDHVGAIPYLANQYNCPIMCTPYTAEVIKSIVKDERIKLRNKIKVLNVNSEVNISDVHIEFINVTHSTPQTVMVAIHTKYGVILYANDFKFDNFPTMGKKPNYKRLEELGNKGISVLIVDGTGAKKQIKTPSESVAKEMLKDVLLGTDSKDKAVIVTTFSSHIARLKSIIEVGKKLNRKIVLLGRSLAKYVMAAEKINLVNFSKDIEIVKFSSQIARTLKKIEKDGIDKYLLVVTGHQGEIKATLSKMARNEIPFKFHKEDHVVFSCPVIPTETNVVSRQELEAALKHHGVRIFRDIHTSGHAAKEDLRDLINLVKPVNLIPAHCDKSMGAALADLADDMGYKSEHVHIMQNGQKINIEQ